MCTVSWSRQSDTYVLLCNRDERHTRKPAQGPKLGKVRGVPLIAPVDGDHGGSWIGVNHFGVTLCLLNRYGDSVLEPERDYTSRGLLLLELMHCRDRSEFQKFLNENDLRDFRPFTLAMVNASEPAMIVHWTGQESFIHPDAENELPLVSSSLGEPEVGKFRNEHFQNLLGATQPASAAVLHEYHRSHFPNRGPYSVCMHREDAGTVSLSVITVGRERIEFSYHKGPACTNAEPEFVKLARVKQ